jgi:hypothetical protein
VLILLIVFGLIPQSSEPTFGAYSTDSRDADNNAHLASNTVNDTTLYDTSQDSSADTQQQLGIDPNWANGISRKSSALKYDGSNDYVTVANPSSLEYANSTFTVDLWFKTTTTSDSILLGKTVGAGGWAIRLYGSSNGGIYAFTKNSSDSACFSRQVGSGYNDGRWHHVAVAFTTSTTVAENNGIVIYVDGVNLSGTASGGSTTYAANTATPVIFGTRGSFDQYFNGYIDEVRISNIARYTSNFSPSRRFTEDTNTVGLWHFDEGSCEGANPCYAKDSSQYANNGQLMNGATNTPAADGSTNGPIFVSGSNAVMDGFKGENPDTSATNSASGQTGAGNLTLGPTSSTTSDKSYEVKTVASSGLSFDGSNDYINVGNSSLLNITGDITTEAWVKTTHSGGTVIGAYSSGIGYGLAIGYYSSGTNTCLVNKVCFANGSYWYGGNTVVTDGKWHHIAASVSSLTLKIFVDGVLDTTQTITSIPSNTANKAIGGRYDGTGSTFTNGSIDEVRISNTARYTTNFTPPRRLSTDASTVGLWHLDDATGTMAIDSSGNNNTGTLMNGTSNSPAADGTTNGPIWTDGIAANTTTSSTAWAMPGYQFRERIKAQNNIGTTLDPGYGLETTKDFGALADNKQARADGNDRRIVYQPADSKRSLSFDHSTPKDQSVLIGKSINSSLSSTATISVWIKPEYSTNRIPGNSRDIIIGTKYWTNNEFTLQLHDNSPESKIAVVWGENKIFYSNTTLATLNHKWSLITLVYDGTLPSNNFSLYVNGKLDIATGSYSGSLLSNSTRDLLIGHSYGNRGIPGSIDDTRIFNRSITGGEVSALYNGGAGLNTPLGGEVGWWAFDEGSGQVVLDKSSNNNNGTLGATASASTDDPTWSTDGVVSTAQEVPRFVPNGHDLNFVAASSQYAVKSSFVGTPTSTFTIETWVKFNSVSTGQQIAEFAGGMQLWMSDTRIVASNMSGSCGACSAVGSIVANNWYHIAAEFNTLKNGYGIKLYLNGVLVSTNTSLLTATPTNSFYLGKLGFGSTEYLNGQLDEVRVSSGERYKNNFTPQTTPFVKDSETLALYHLDEGSGLTAVDSSGNGNSADMTGHAPTWVTNGGYVKSTNQTDFKTIAPIAASGSDTDYYLYYGNLNEKGSPLSYTATGLKFDGTDDYVGLGQPSSLNFIGQTNAFSYSTWIKHDNVGSIREYIVAKANGSNTQYSVAVDVDGKIVVNIGGTESIGTTNIKDNNWHLVTVTVPAASSGIIIYLDGSAQAFTSGTGGIGTTSNALDALIGARRNASNADALRYVNARLDDARIYNRALSAPEVSALYSNSPSVSNTGLVGWWKLDNSTPASTSALDSSGSGNTGTLTNFNFDQNSNWTVNNSLLHASTEPTVSMMSSVIEQESPMFYQYRDSTGGPAPTYSAWSTRAPISATLQQLGATGVYVKFNPSGAYSTQDTYRIASWAVEAFSTSAPQRGKRRSFPEKANIIIDKNGTNSGGIDIIDATTNILWMRLNTAYNVRRMLHMYDYGANIRVEMLNGRLYAQGSYYDALYSIQFDLDGTHAYSTSGGRPGNAQFAGNIAKRNADIPYANLAGPTTGVGDAKDISVAIIGNKHFIAVGGSDGVYVFQDETSVDFNPSTDMKVIKYSASSTKTVALTKGGRLYLGEVSGYLKRFDGIQNDLVDRLTADATYTTSSTPALRSGAINAISVTEGTSLADYTSNQVALATDLGVEVIHEHSTMASGYTEHYTSTGSVGTSKYSSKQFGNGLLFDGTGDYVTVPSSSSMAITNSITLEAWVYALPGQSQYRKVIYRRNASDLEWNLDVDTSGTKWRGYLNAGNIMATDPDPIVTGVWTHLAFTYDGFYGRLFVNGVLKNSSALISGVIDTVSNPLEISNSGSGQSFKGNIDEVRISNTARYSSNFTPSSTPFTRDANTVGLWHMDERYGGAAGINGQYVYDDSGNNNNGTLGATAAISTDDPTRVSPSIAGADKVTAVGMNKSNDAGRDVDFDVYSTHSVLLTNDTVLGTADLTISVWLKPNIVFPGSSYIDLKIYDDAGASINDILQLYIRATSAGATSLCTYIRSSATGGTIDACYGAALNQAWHHVVLTRIGTSLLAHLDGKLIGTRTDAGITDVNLIGGIKPRIGLSMAGAIDDTRVYSRALNSAEISQLYNGGQGTTSNSLSNIASWWKFNDGSGITAADSASNNHGTLTAGSGNIPTWSTGSPVKEQSALWVGTNGSGANDGAVTAISQATQRQITAYTTANSSLPDNDVTSLSLGTGGLALVGTEAGAWPAGMAGIPVDDTAATPASGQPTSDRLKSGTIRFKSGTIRLK